MRPVCLRLPSLLLWVGLTVAEAHEQGAVHYLGNAGVLMEAGETRVVFDAFYAESYGQYQLVPDALRADLNDGTPPFENVDLVLVSHVHGDHFSPDMAITWLRGHPHARLVGTAQVQQAIAEAVSADDPLLERVTGVDLQPDDAPWVEEVGPVTVAAVAVPHAGGERHAAIQNLIFRATGPGITTVHFGDAAVDDDAFARHQAHWDARRPDFALPPYWFFLDPVGRSILENRIRAAHEIGIHVPARAAEDPEGWRRQTGADLFTRPGERRRVGQPVNR